MSLRTFTVLLVFILFWVCPKPTEAATTLLVSYGALEQGEVKLNFYTLEAVSAHGALTDFEFTSLRLRDNSRIVEASH